MLLDPILAVILLFTRIASAASTIQRYSDSNCQTGVSTLSGPNGYPDGTCSKLNLDGGSFKILSLDLDCVVTIYQSDTSNQVCSGKAILAERSLCYNSAYVYYSIDECSGVANSVAVSSTASIASTSSQQSDTNTPTSTANLDTSASISASLPTSSTSSQSASTDSPESNSAPSTGTIAGASVAGVVGLAVIVGLIWFCMGKRRRSSQSTINGDRHAPLEMETASSEKRKGGFTPAELEHKRANETKVSELEAKRASAQNPSELESHHDNRLSPCELEARGVHGQSLSELGSD